jgi:hypothetical protein
MLTVSGTGAFSVNYSGIQPMSFSDNGVKGSIQYSGQASGQLQVSGSRLSGTTQSSTFKVKSKINGVSFNLPLPKVTAGTKAPWCHRLAAAEPEAASIRCLAALAPRTGHRGHRGCRGQRRRRRAAAVSGHSSLRSAWPGPASYDRAGGGLGNGPGRKGKLLGLV